MGSFGNKLGDITILSSSQAKTIDKYIQVKYKNYSQEDRAIVFNDAVFKVLDKELKLIDDKKRQVLEQVIFEEARNRYEFFINGYDVVNGITSVENEGFLAVGLVEEWLSNHLDVGERLEVVRDLKVYLDLDEPSVSDENPVSEDWLVENEIIENEFVDDVIDDDEPIEVITPEDVLNFFRALRKSLKRLTTVRLSKRGKSLMWSLLALLVFYLSSHYSQERLQPLMIMEEEATNPPPAIDVKKVATIEIDIEPLLEKNQTNVIVSTIPVDVLAGNMPLIAYRPIDENALRNYLTAMDSLLSQSPYFEAILETAEAYNLNPLLLFAITGQEQGFVVLTESNAQRMANNPFNVFGSWQKYNTNIYDAAAIASRTIVLLSQDCPEGMNPLTWINRKYAEDKNWWVGVSKILDHLEDQVAYMDS
jgi:hypothetical protein